LNLRVGTHGENSQNLKLYKNNTSGFTGVTFSKWGKWRAEIWVSGRAYHLGYFDTPELAYAAYLEGKRRLHAFQPTPRAA
jgi:hypothetical protein